MVGLEHALLGRTGHQVAQALLDLLKDGLAHMGAVVHAKTHCHRRALAYRRPATVTPLRDRQTRGPD